MMKNVVQKIQSSSDIEEVTPRLKVAALQTINKKMMIYQMFLEEKYSKSTKD